jgi:hypothetical protein
MNGSRDLALTAGALARSIPCLTRQEPFLPDPHKSKLDRMNFRQWMAIAWIAIWAGQFLNLWPLPMETSRQLLETARELGPAAPPDAAKGIASYERILWFSWFLHITFTPLAIAAGVVMWRGHPKWPALILVVSVATFFIFRVWQLWAPIYGPLFASVERALYRAEWLLTEPRLVYNTVVFPALLVASAIYAAATLHRRRMRHAI